MDQLGFGHSPRLMDMHTVYHLSDIWHPLPFNNESHIDLQLPRPGYRWE
jgi:hypothetical protein